MNDDASITVASAGDESSQAYEDLHTKQIKIVSNRRDVPEDGKYISVRDVVSASGWLAAAFEFGITLLLFKSNFAPSEYSRTYVTGGNLVFSHGLREELDPSFFGEDQLMNTLSRLHEKKLRYIEMKSPYNSSRVRDCVDKFNKRLQQDAQFEIIAKRNQLRAGK